MMRLPAMVKKYAELDGRPEKQIQWYARVARENGLITSGKRGAGASEMTVTDAINLILACNSVPDPKVAPTVVPLLRKLPQGLFFADEQGINISAMKDVIAAQTLGAALGALMCAAKAVAAELLARRGSDQRSNYAITHDPFNAMIGLDVAIWLYGAEIIIWEGNPVLGSDVLFRLQYLESGPPSERYGKPSHRQTRSVLSLEVFRALGAAILTTAEKNQ